MTGDGVTDRAAAPPSPSSKGRRRAFSRALLSLVSGAAVVCVALWLTAGWWVAWLVNGQLLGRASWREMRFSAGVVRFAGVEIFDATSDLVLTSPEIRIAFSLRDLLLRRSLPAAVSEVVVEAPRVDVTRRSDGTLNIAEVYRVPTVARPLVVSKLFHGVVRVRNAAVRLKDEHTPFGADFRDINGAIDMTDVEHGRGGLTFVELTRGAGGSSGIWRLDATWKHAFIDVRARVEVDGLDVALWTSYVRARVEDRIPPLARGNLTSGKGRVRLLVSLLGAVASWRDTLHLSGTIAVDGLAGRFDNLPLAFDRGHLRCALTRDMLTLKRLSAYVGKDYVEVAGRLFDRARPQIDMEVMARTPSLAETLRRAGIASPVAVEGRGQATVQLLGAVAGPPLVKVAVSAPLLRLAGHRLRDVVGRFSWVSRAWRVHRVSARAEGGSLQAGGWVFVGDKPRVMLDVRTRDARLAAFVGALAGVDARASADLTIIGTRQSPLVMGRGSVRDATVQGVSVSDASGRFVYHGRALLFSDIDVATGVGRFRAPVGYFDLAGARELFAHVVGTGISHAVGKGAVHDGAVSMVVAGPPKRLFAAGRVQAGAVTAGGVTLRDVDALVALSPHLYWLSRASFVLGGGRVTASGAVAPADRTFDLAAWSSGLDLGAFTVGLPKAAVGLAKGRGAITFEAAGASRRAAFRLGMGGARPLEVSGVWDDGGVRGVAFGQALDGALLSTFGLARWYPRGALDVMALFAVRGKAFDLDAAGRSRGFRVAGVPFDRASFSASSAHGVMHVREGWLSGPAAVVSLFGRIPLRDSATWNLQWSADLADLHRIVPGLEVGADPVRVQNGLRQMRLLGLSGHGFATGRVEGTRRSPQVGGSVLVDRGRLHGDTLFMQGDFCSTRGKVAVADTRIVLGGDIVDVDGSVGISAQPRLNLTVTTPQLALQRALGFTPYARLDAAGWLDGRVSVTGRVGHVAAAGRLHLQAGRVGTQPIDDARMTMRAGDGNIIVKRLLARIGTGTVTGSGELNLNGPLALDLSTRDFPLEEVAAARGTPLSRGRGEVEVRLRGTSSQPALDASFDLRGLAPSGAPAPLAAKGRLRWHGSRLEAERAALTLEGRRGAVTVDGFLDFVGRALPTRFDDLLAARGDVSVSLREAPVSEMLELAGQTRRKASGMLTGAVRAHGVMGHPSLSGNLEGTEMRLGGVDVGTVQMGGAYDADRGEVTGLEIASQGPAGTLHVSGSGNKQSGKLSLASSDFEIGALAPLLPWRFPFSGRVGARFDGSGPLFEPNVEGRFAVVDGRLSAVAFDAFTGAVSGSDGVYHLDDFVLRMGQHRATLRGVLPLRYEGGVFTNPSPIDIHGSVTEDSLELLSLFVPDILPSAGRLRARLDISGQSPHVQWNGDLTVRDGTIRHKVLAQSIDNVDVTVTLRGERLQVHSGGRLGNGQLSVAGGADVAGFGLTDMNIRLSGKQLGVLAPPYLESVLDADLHLTGSTADPYLVGSVNARSARISLPLRGLAGLSAFSASPSAGASPEGHTSAGGEEATEGGARAPFPLPPVTYSVELSLGSDTWLRFLGSAVRGEGHLALVGKGSAAVPTGEIVLKQGQIQVPFFPVTLRITSGRAYFDPSSGWTPYLDATATAMVGQYEVYADMKGTASNPNVRLSSNPPLPPAAIRQLVLGGSVAQSNIMGPGGYTQNTSLGLNALVNVAQATFLRPVTSFFGRLFGMSEVSVELLNQSLLQVTVYKALDSKQKLFAVFTALQGEQQQAFPRQFYGFEYRFTPTHLARVTSDNLGVLHFFYQARWRF